MINFEVRQMYNSLCISTNRKISSNNSMNLYKDQQFIHTFVNINVTYIYIYIYIHMLRISVYNKVELTSGEYCGRNCLCSSMITRRQTKTFSSFSVSSSRNMVDRIAYTTSYTHSITDKGSWQHIVYTLT